MPSTPPTPAGVDTVLHDLGPLAWVLDALRKSLEGAAQAMHRFVRDAELARGAESAELDTSHLRVARQQLHQAVGALEMVDLPAPARMAQAMESAVQRFVLQPALCSFDAAQRLERASFALSEYLEGLLKGKSASSVALFPQYRAVQELAGAERIHPADLWAQQWHWLPLAQKPGAPALPYLPEVRAHLDHAVLQVVKSADVQAAAKLAHVCTGLAAAQTRLEPRSFWTMAAAYFEALALSLLPADIYTKRAASRILQQYAALAKGDATPGERLAQDLVFFCAQAQPAPDAAAAALRAVRATYGLADSVAVDYQTEQFGRFDPAQLALARKRIAAATETWSALAGGDTSRLQQAGMQFSAVTESILKLHPNHTALPQELHAVLEAATHAGEAPTPAVAMEVATAVLFLEAAYADLEPTDDQMVARSQQLASRLQQLRAGAEPQPLEAWMEELYRHVSERQTMGNVVAELRTRLDKVEAALERFFSNPADKAPLQDVPGQLAHMRGVFSVLGLEQADLATLRMHDSVDQLLADAVDGDAARSGIFERLGNSLGALGLLVDMLSYQRALAQKLFVYDAVAGELKPLMGLHRRHLPELVPSEAPAPIASAASNAADVEDVADPTPPAEATEADADVDVDVDVDALAATASAVDLDVELPGPDAAPDFLPTQLVDAPAEAAAYAPEATDAPEFAATQIFDADASPALPQRPAPAAPAPTAVPRGSAGPAFELDFPPDEPEVEEEEAAPDWGLSFDLELPLSEREPEPEPAEADEQTKVIGDLRLGIPLYNVFLNEADEWSRRLMTELSEWALELHRPLPRSALVLAHSLGGSSATVGFTALAEVARTLERALEHVRLHGQGQAAHAQVFNDAAEDIRRLLHQFAAGFLKTADTRVLQALKDILATEFPTPVLEVVDADLFPIFQEEAAEWMPALGVALRQWVARPDNLGARAEGLRVLHTLKGSARLAGAMRLGEMAHRMESGIEALGTEGLQSPQLEPLLAQLDALQATLDALDLAPGLDASPLDEPLAPPSAPAADSAPAGAPLADPVSLEQVTRAVPRNAAQSVRVRSQLLDRLVNQAGEVMISRARMDAHIAQMRGSMGELSGNLDRLRQQLRDVEVQAESQMQSRLAQSKDEAQAFDPLELDRFTRVQELTRMMAESVNDVATVQRNLQRSIEGAEDDLVAQARQARELQRDLLRTRMVEFEGIAERLYGVVRQSAKVAGKQVALSIEGGHIEMDRGVLDRMTPAFEHILRNAVAHGIEAPALRLAAGKPEAGSITISVQQESNDVSVSIADDGAGLHMDSIRAQAIAHNLITPDATLSAAEAANLLFTPGFSTASEVTELAGRGIGMDVVLTELNALGGRVETSTQAGQGTTFRLVLPLTTAITQVVMLRMGDFHIGVPASLMETVLRAPLATVTAAYQQGSYAHGGQEVPFLWGGALWQVSGRSQEVPARHLPVAVFRSAGQRLALHVDEVLGTREVVVKNLGPQLARLPGLAGMSVLASGAVVLIYNPVALATVYGADARALMAAAAPAAEGAAPQATEALAPLVLVVDDSITVRRVTQRLLKREGFRVALASDGLQALELLAQEKPLVLLTDIEMPRMDGFDLVRSIRADDTLRDLPVILITSRIAPKHRDHAAELGVDHYLGKPYSEEELLALIRSYADVAGASGVSPATTPEQGAD